MGKQWKQWLTLSFGALKITADGDCSHEIRRRLLLGRKAMTNLDSVLKSSQYSANKGLYSQGYDLPSGRARSSEMTVKKAERQRIAFKLWCWRRLLKVPWTARRSNQSILREINPEYPLEGLMLRLKLQYFSHLMWTDDSLEKSLMLGKIKGRRWRECQRMRWLGSITDAMNVNSHQLWETVRTGRPGMPRSTELQRVGPD